MGTSSIRVVAQVSDPAAGPVVVTTDGPVRGLVTNGVNTYLGIPYAAPPVGDLRWRPPAPPPTTILSMPRNLRTRVRK
jgi:para-nitrobenzyl esterase